MGFPKTRGGRGFRDLVSFNKALLANQCWKLLQNLNSLAATIIKAKYYLHSTILEAMVGKRPSFAWRSIMSAYDLLKNGLVCRVGDGKDIKIWGDRWLPTPTSFFCPVSMPNLSCKCEGSGLYWSCDFLVEFTSPPQGFQWEGSLSYKSNSIKSSAATRLTYLARYDKWCVYCS